MNYSSYYNKRATRTIVHANPEREERVRNLKLQTAREKSGKTQAQIAKKAGVSERAYQGYEYGQKEPGVRTAIRIADALNVTDLRELFAEYPHTHDTTCCQARGQEETQ